MGNTEQYRGIITPNMINICVDESGAGEIMGRMYHCYSTEPVIFANIVELIREAEKLFDGIAFPQASTQARSFVEKENRVQGQCRRPEKIVDYEKVSAHRGRQGSFLTHVRFRQNATWQGDAYWLEQSKTLLFTNTLDFIKQIDAAIASVLNG